MAYSVKWFGNSKGPMFELLCPLVVCAANSFKVQVDRRSLEFCPRTKLGCDPLALGGP